MKNKKKLKKANFFITLLIIIFIFSILIFIKLRSNEEINEKVVKCIASKSALYVQFGCFACKKQEEVFGKYYKYLNVTDCFYEPNKCQNIRATPTWIINGKEYIGVMSIKKIRNLTGC